MTKLRLLLAFLISIISYNCHSSEDIQTKHQKQRIAFIKASAAALFLGINGNILMNISKLNYNQINTHRWYLSTCALTGICAINALTCYFGKYIYNEKSKAKKICLAPPFAICTYISITATANAILLGVKAFKPSLL